MKFGIVGNWQKENLARAVSGLLDKLHNNDIGYLIDEEVITYLHKSGDTFSVNKNSVVKNEIVFSDSDIVIAMGGDGTILRFSRWAAAQNKPILGVNLGKLGFLAEVSTDELSECIDEIIRGDYIISNRFTIGCSIENQPELNIYGINDIVIDRGGLLRVIDVETYVDNDYLLTFKGDGLIIGTPTGSTGYSLSCGGPIVSPDTNVMIITPVSPHTLNARPIIIPADKVIRTVVSSPEKTVQLSADGQLQKHLNTPVELIFRRSDIQVKLIKRKVRSYYDVLREKLMWGRDVRVAPVSDKS